MPSSEAEAGLLIELETTRCVQLPFASQHQTSTTDWETVLDSWNLKK